MMAHIIMEQDLSSNFVMQKQPVSGVRVALSMIFVAKVGIIVSATQLLLDLKSASDSIVHSTDIAVVHGMLAILLGLVYGNMLPNIK